MLRPNPSTPLAEIRKGRIAVIVRRSGDDLKHGTNAAYVHGCVCSECRTHQRIRMARNRWIPVLLNTDFSADYLGYAIDPCSFSPSGSETTVKLGVS